jgi:hypothetical protein
MVREISFNAFGDIIVTTETHTDRIERGIVLLTPEQVTRAAQWGWKEIVSAPSDIEHGLRRVEK